MYFFLVILGRGSGGSLPRTPKGKMPLTGKVAGYRQQPQWQQQQQQNQQHPNPNSDPNLAIYGYMDDQKISMIQNWVECQSNQRHVVHQQQHQKAMMQHTAKNQAEPEPFAWLNEGQEATLDEGCKVLTQFKTVESDDSEKDDQGVIGKIRYVKVVSSKPSGKRIIAPILCF